MVSPTRRRDAASYLQRRHKVSERRACRVVDLHRSTQRYRRGAGRLRAALGQADEHPRRSPSPLRLPEDLGAASRGGLGGQPQADRAAVAPGGPPGATSAVEGLGQTCPGRRQTTRCGPCRRPRPNDVWSYDFMSVRTRSGRRIRILNVVDEYTRVCVGCRVARSSAPARCRRYLEEMFAKHGKAPADPLRQRPGVHRRSLTSWLAEQGVTCCVHREGLTPAEPLRRTVQRHDARRDARTVRSSTTCSRPGCVLGAWVEEYNARRPHRGLGMMTPRQFAAECRRAA